MKVFQVVGYQNTGKTTLICRLIEWFSEAGYRVGTIKHDAHRTDFDREGKDTWRHRRAGAETAAIVSGSGTALFSSHPLTPAELLKRLGDPDIVLLEGFKREHYPKIVMVRTPADWELAGQLTNVAAVAAWPDMMRAIPTGRFAVHPLDDIGGIASRLLSIAERGSAE